MTSENSEQADPSVSDASANDALGDAEEVTASGEVAPAEIEARRGALESIIEMLRPAVQMDGGDLELVEADYVNGVVEVQLQGACGSCAISGATLTGGVERILKERLDWVTEVIGGVDEEIDEFESAALGRGAYVPKYY